MTSKKAFMAAATGVLALSLLAGCADSPYGVPSSATRESTGTGILIETIQKGDFLEGLDDGAYKITFPAEKLGREKDMVCIAVKDTAVQKGYGGLSCDFK